MKKIFFSVFAIISMPTCYGIQSAGVSTEVQEVHLQQMARVNAIIDWIKLPNNNSDFWNKYAELLSYSKMWFDTKQKLEKLDSVYSKENANYQEIKAALADKNVYELPLNLQQQEIQALRQLMNNAKTLHDTQLVVLLQQFPPIENKSILQNSVTIEDTYVIATLNRQ